MSLYYYLIHYHIPGLHYHIRGAAAEAAGLSVNSRANVTEANRRGDEVQGRRGARRDARAGRLKDVGARFPPRFRRTEPLSGGSNAAQVHDPAPGLDLAGGSPYINPITRLFLAATLASWGFGASERKAPPWEALSELERAYLLDVHGLDAGAWAAPADGEYGRLALVEEAAGRAEKRRLEVQGLLGAVEAAPTEEKLEAAVETLERAGITDRTLRAWGLDKEPGLEQRIEAAERRFRSLDKADAFGPRSGEADKQVGVLKARYSAGGAGRLAADLDGARLFVRTGVPELFEPAEGPLIETDPAKQREEIFRQGLKPPAGGLEYTAPGARKPGLFQEYWGHWKEYRSLFDRKSTLEELKRLQELQARLATTPSGRRLVEELGGPSAIRNEVHLAFGAMGFERKYAYTQRLGPWDQARLGGKDYAVVLGDHLKDEPDEVLVPILAHELTHVRDFQRGLNKKGLQIPMESASHREQIYVGDELTAGAPPERLQALKKNPHWQNQQFIEALWKDRIVERFPTENSFMDEFAGEDYSLRAQAAYQDLKAGTARPGSSHLDFHLRDVYNTMTNERDIAELIKDSDGPRDLETLRTRNELVGSMAVRDREIRATRGYELPGQ